MDQLEHIVEMQKKLVDRYMQLPEYQGFTKEQLLEKMTIASLVETVESLNELPWKPWKKDKTIDRAKALEELADELHFLMHRALLLGFGAEDLYQAYQQKNEENHRRLDGKSEKAGYAEEPRPADTLELSPEDKIKANMIGVRIAGSSSLSLEQVKQQFFPRICQWVREGVSNEQIFQNINLELKNKQ